METGPAIAATGRVPVAAVACPVWAREDIAEAAGLVEAAEVLEAAEAEGGRNRG